MGVTRRIIFPVIRILIFAAIAVALVKLAFVDDDAADAEQGTPLSPTAEITTSEVPVGRGSVVNTVTVDATIAADPAIEVKATEAGTVNVLLADPGDVVAKGDPVLEVVYEEQVEAPAGSGDETDEGEGGGDEAGDEGDEPAQQASEPRRRHHTIEAPADGTLGAFSVLRGQDVAIGDAVSSITTGGFSVTGTLTPEQQYRLVNAPTAAQVAAKGGPAPFACSGLSIGRPAASGQQQDGQPDATGDGSGGTGSTTQVRCAVPAGTTVFDGLVATMSIEAGRAEDVLVVPVTAVEGSFAAGNVWVVASPGAEPEKRPVTLGLTDGEFVEVSKGLAEGETILEFVPVTDDVIDEGMGEMGEVVEGAAG